MPWGLYDAVHNKGIGSQTIRAEDVPGPGYHWYKLGTFPVGSSYYLWFFWSWIIQVDVDTVADPRNPDQRFEIWARIKYTGPPSRTERPRTTTRSAWNVLFWSRREQETPKRRPLCAIACSVSCELRWAM